MRRDRTRGLTLVELVIAIALAGLLGVPIGMLVSEQLRSAIQARDHSVAMNLARAEMERLDSLNNFCHADLNVTGLSPPALVGYWPGYDLTRIVTCAAGNCASQSPGVCHPPTNTRNGLKRVDLRVTRTGSGELAASLTTYRTKYVLFGS
ncbi:MAG: hypothetical protein COV75_08825 [Candidatus Omnitrophica bacterium CG11_big_fil_rev_8_21_14_0_20_63_9]|nr:MAG: hypothetical protein COV75_08825 [Candidatus Omnitrophica bacterium CG11_big_fil_rev_8_21_14_0_20_63_9]